MEVVVRRPRRSSLVALLVAVTLVGAALGTASPAFALTGGVTVNPQVGGVPTRFTFEGQTSAGDQPVSEVAFNFPEGFDLSTARAEALTLEGLTRVPVSAQTSVEGQRVLLKFEPPIAPTYKDSSGAEQPTTLRIYTYDVVTTNKGGTYELPATYVAGGQEKSLLTSGGSPLTFQYSSPSQADIISRYLDKQAWVRAINNVKILSLFVKPQLIALSVPLLFYGWLYSIALVLIAFPLAIILGLLLAFSKMSRIAPLRWLASAYVNVIRGTPLFLQIAVVFIGLRVAGFRVPDFISAITVLALNSSAYLTEIFRAGIQSIARGQFEAASSLGMTYAQSMRYVIIPQTVKRVLPTMTSEFILLFKDTALFSAFGILELMYRANSIVSRTGNLTPFVIAAVYYLIVTIPLINWVGRLEKRLAVSEGGHAAAPKSPARPKRGVLLEAAPEGLTRTVDTETAGSAEDVLGGSQEGDDRG